MTSLARLLGAPSSFLRRLRSRQWHARPRRAARPQQSQPFAGLEPLERRVLLSADVLTVNTFDDVVDPNDGVLSLREAIIEANSTMDANTIEFDNSLSGGTIVLSGMQLPTITGDLTILGLGADQLTIDADGGSRIFQITADATVELSGLKLTGGHAFGLSVDGFGGAIFNEGALTLTDTTLSGNAAVQHGGGIFNTGTLTLTNSALSANTANLGGGIRNTGTLTLTNSTLSDNTSNLDGGGIANLLGGTLTLTNSTLSDNSALRHGGALFNNNGTMLLINSTLSGNAANGTGGAIHNRAVLTVTNSTIALNRADANGNGSGSGGGIITLSSPSSATTLNNTIVAGNLRGAVNSDQPNDLDGPVAVSSAHNLIGDAGTSGGLNHGEDGNIVGGAGGALDIETILDTTLADNGGPTFTHALVAGSPAINAGNDSLVPTGITTDQRGVSRFFGAVDIGAYELHVEIPLTLIVNTFDDVVDPNDGVLSLREAIYLSNLSPTADAITFDPALAGETLLLSGEQLPTITGNLTITGLGANQLILQSMNQVQERFFEIAPDATAQISGLTLMGAVTEGNGGAILNNGTLTVSNTVLMDNLATGGGTIFNNGTLVVNSTALINNYATDGGAIFNSGMLTVINSTLSGNMAFRDGGGIFNDGALTVINSTIVRNRADADGNGTGTGSGIRVIGPTTLINTIVAGNLGGDLAGNVESTSAHNLIGHPFASGGLIDGVNNNIVGIPLHQILVPVLADNGGPTLTHALVSGSPAIDAGDDSLVPAGVTSDQRGEPRFIGTVDIGAFEWAVTFADTNLEAAVREALNYSAGPISLAQVQSLTELVASGQQIVNLGGLEHATNLQILDLSNNQISDLWPLAGLINLEVLLLASNHISDITPLEGLINLQVLDLSNQSEPDGESAGAMTFSLMATQVTAAGLSDITPLENLIELVELNLAGNQIVDITPLTALTNLQHLELQDNQIADIAPLAGLSQLQHLNLESNSILFQPGSPAMAVIETLQTNNQNLSVSFEQQNPIPQTLDFSALDDLTYGDGPIVLTATASSGLPVTFEVVSGPATIEGNILSIAGTGTVVVRATQAGDDIFAPAEEVVRSFEVERAVLEVDLDIRPESLNVEQNGVILLVISGSEVFNVQDQQDTILSRLAFVYRHETESGDVLELSTGEIDPLGYEFISGGNDLLVRFALSDLRDFLRGVYAHLLVLGDSTSTILSLTGDYDENHTFEGDDNVNLLLNGRALREFLEQLSEYEWWDDPA